MSLTFPKFPAVVLLILLGSSVLAQEVSDAEAHFGRGEAYLQSNQFAEAVKEFGQAIRLKPRWPEAHFKLGMAYSAMSATGGGAGENLTAAFKAFEEAVRLNPDWPEALVELGSKYSSFQQYDKAIKTIRKAIGLKPGLAEAHLHLGITYLYTGHYRDAITSLQEAIRLKPTEPLPHKLAGLAYLVVDERGKALEEYETLKTLDTEMAQYLNTALQSPTKPTFGVVSGKLISVPKPDYPAEAKGISGRVTVEVTIDERGKVVSSRAISGPVKLHGAAEAAALKARFMPTKLSGKAVSVRGVITFNFESQ